MSGLRKWPAAAGFAIGFLAGAGLGVVWGNGAKSRVSGAVTTQYDHGNVVTRVDVAKIAAGGFSDLLR